MAYPHNFEAILEEIGDLQRKKNMDYGRDHDPYANIRGSVDWGIPPWQGAMIRANDKLKRLQKFAKDGTLANESVEDSFKDLAVYALIALDLFRQDKSPTEPVEFARSGMGHEPVPTAYHYEPDTGRFMPGPLDSFEAGRFD